MITVTQNLDRSESYSMKFMFIVIPDLGKGNLLLTKSWQIEVLAISLSIKRTLFGESKLSLLGTVIILSLTMGEWEW